MKKQDLQKLIREEIKAVLAEASTTINIQPKWVNMFDLENAVKKEFSSKGRHLSKDEIDEFIKKQLPKINQGEGKYKKSVEALAKEMFKINESVNEASTTINIKNISDIDHTRLIKWIGQNLNSSVDVKKSSKGFKVDASKMTRIDKSDLINYLKSNRYIA